MSMTIDRTPESALNLAHRFSVPRGLDRCKILWSTMYDSDGAPNFRNDPVKNEISGERFEPLSGCAATNGAMENIRQRRNYPMQPHV
jgi:hypothetical protein